MKEGVIVLGGHIQGLNIARIYGKAGIDVIVLDNDSKNLAKHSKFTKAFYLYQDSNFLPLLEHFKHHKLYKNWLIIPTNDAQVKLLSENKTYLERYFKVSTHNWQVVQKCYNKIYTYTIAKELNIPIAWTIFPQSKDELISRDDIPYPCIIKPAVMHTFYSKFKKKVFVCNNRKELLLNYEEASKVIPKDEIIIQDIIPGSSMNQYSVGAFFTNKEMINHIIVRRKRQHPIDFGNATTFAESVEIEELKELANRFLEHIDYSGLCEVEFKFDSRDKSYKLLEINPRTWKWHSISEKAEVPFLLSLYYKTFHNRVIATKSFKKSCFRHLLLDSIMRLFYKEYRKQKTTCSKKETQLAVWDKTDLAPAFWELIYFPYNILKR